MHRGFIKLWRCSTEHELYFGEKFTRWSAWVDLLLLANHKDNYYLSRGIQISVKRGQVGYSIKKLAERWKWSEEKVKSFLVFLQGQNMIQIQEQKIRIATIITIVNYDLYQEQNRVQTENRTGTNKNVKNEEEDKYMSDCQIILEYFNRTCKKELTLTNERKKIIIACLKEGKTVDQLKQAITNFSLDTWEDRKKYMDLVYAIGKRNKTDNFERWFHLSGSSIPAIKVKFDKDGIVMKE